MTVGFGESSGGDLTRVGGSVEPGSVGSLNCTFSGQVASSDPNLPAGEPLMAEMRGTLQSAGWESDAPDLWRDSGWSVVARQGDERVEVVVAPLPDGAWILQVAPLHEPGILGRLLKRGPSASAESVYSVSLLTHQHLAAAGMQTQRWCWDGFPPEAASTDAPQPRGDA